MSLPQHGAWSTSLFIVACVGHRRCAERYYELRRCPVWRRGRNKYDYNLFRPGLRRPALKWHCVGTRRYLQSKVAGGAKLYLHRLAAFLVFRHRSHRRADFWTPLREVHHFDVNERNNCWRNLRQWTKVGTYAFTKWGLVSELVEYRAATS